MACHECGNANVLSERRKDINITVGKFGDSFPITTLFCKQCNNEHFNGPELLEAEETLARRILNSDDELTGEEFKYVRKYMMIRNKDIWKSLDIAPIKGLSLERDKKNSNMPKDLVDKLREISRQ